MKLPYKHCSVGVLWLTISSVYLLGQSALYAQDNTTPYEEKTPYEHLTLEAALLLAVGVQYRENRKKEDQAAIMSKDAAAAIARATEIMENVTTALERLTVKVEQRPIRTPPHS